MYRLYSIKSPCLTQSCFRYELIFARLIKHTDLEHPDQKSLQDASKLVHNILLHINCMEKEALENGHREATLKDLEVSVIQLFT